jgi:hypothetical protein
LAFVLPLLIGCGALTGIPGHGGGKRFAVEQELVAAATRAVIKKIDLAPIRGRKVNLFVNAIGDIGAGNLVGGRYSIVSQFRGDYIQTPPVTETFVYPRYTATSSTSSTTGSSTTTATQTTEELLSAPVSKKTRQEGGAATLQAGVEYEGMGAYHNSEEITSDDLQYLFTLMQTYLFLRGVYIAPPSEAEVDVYITVDVFGTVYTRVDWLLANNEILQAKTSLEVMAVDHWTGELLMAPQSAAAESEYNEQYVLWAGPVHIRKTLRNAKSLMSDFTNLREEKSAVLPIDREEHSPYPFQYEIEKYSVKSMSKQN